jgi:hypothetical protein
MRCAIPFLNYQLITTLGETYLNKNRVSTLKREHAVLYQVFGQVDEVYNSMQPLD